MARYKHIDTSPRFLAVDLQRQLLSGTFEHAMNHLIDHALDLSSFDARFKNDITGAAAYPPAMLLKVVLFAYSMGIISSRNIERACREHVTFIALSGGSQFYVTKRFATHCAPRLKRCVWRVLSSLMHGYCCLTIYIACGHYLTAMPISPPFG